MRIKKKNMMPMPLLQWQHTSSAACLRCGLLMKQNPKFVSSFKFYTGIEKIMKN